jgi:putative SOS response-associated peptidase YedK
MQDKIPLASAPSIPPPELKISVWQWEPPWEEAKELARPLPNDALIISSREPYGSSIVSKSGEPVEHGGLL